MFRYGLFSLFLSIATLETLLAVRMLLNPSQHKCLKHDSYGGVIVNGHYEASEPVSHQIDIVIKDSKDHLLYKRENIAKGTFAFSTEDYDLFEVCFISHPIPGLHNAAYREIFLDVKHGAEAKNFDLLAKAEKLKPVEAELKRLEALTDEIVRDFNNMHNKSNKMRNTNESTHSRVLYFSVFSMFTLIGFACWQVLYLRRYFKSKKLIE
ncbi:p24 family protein delta-1 [Paragonimus westermani]|uniref:p24 family protein delta-1 n=1 Tax=Paragonimus westermani TaxID=34504 RepID=A0A5J4P430_9TREM|nr:p24 family protein delta-1 [Paragonimus westermani]